jgi:hypothetical protein
MRFKLIIAAVAGALIVAPQTAHAGAAEAVCADDGRLTLRSTDSSLLQFPQLWDFEVRNVRANGTAIGFGQISGADDFEQYATNSAVPAGTVVEFEFRQIRNLREGGNGFASEWTTHRLEAPACGAPTTTPPATAPPTTISTVITVAPTTLAAPTTTQASTITGENPVLPTLPRSTSIQSDDLPTTGTSGFVLISLALGFVAVGLSGLVIARREG